MWLGRYKMVEVYLGTTTLGVRRGQNLIDWYPVPDIDTALVILSDSLKRSANQHVQLRVWLSAAYSRPFLLSADCGAKTRPEALALANASAAVLTGYNTDVLIWLDYWHIGTACAAVAMPKNIFVRLRDMCLEHRVRLVSVKPWWSLAIGIVQALSRKNEASICWSVAEPDGLTNGIAKTGQMLEMNSCELLPHDLEWGHVRQRAIVSVGESAVVWHAKALLSKAAEFGHQSKALPLDLPIASWLDSSALPLVSSSMNIEFMEPSRPGKLMWFFLAGALTLLIGAWVLLGWQLHQVSTLKQSIVNVRTHQAMRQSTVAHDITSASTLLYVDNARQAWGQGRFEAQAALTSLETVATEGVVLSSIDIDAERGIVRVELDAQDFPIMDHYLDLLNKRTSAPGWSLVSISASNATLSEGNALKLHAIILHCERSSSELANCETR